MGSLAKHIAERFATVGLAGWEAEPEARLFSDVLARRYRFSPRVDVLFRKKGEPQRRLVVELEVSRADPVANQLKYLLARDAGEAGPDDVLVSMFSPAIEPGRRSVCGVFAGHLRRNGIAAFQVSLLPMLAPERVKILNRPGTSFSNDEELSVEGELDRVRAVVEPRGERAHRIHFAGDVADVVANACTWNREIAEPKADLWGQRSVQYFVHDPAGRQFAPSKFCAFVPAPRNKDERPPATMTLDLYAELGEEDPRFDGHRARKHLEQHLAFECVALEQTDLGTEFSRWAAAVGARVALRGQVQLLLPPRWYR